MSSFTSGLPSSIDVSPSKERNWKQQVGSPAARPALCSTASTSGLPKYSPDSPSSLDQRQSTSRTDRLSQHRSARRTFLSCWVRGWCELGEQWQQKEIKALLDNAGRRGLRRGCCCVAAHPRGTSPGRRHGTPAPPCPHHTPYSPLFFHDPNR